MTVYARPGADGALMSFDARYRGIISSGQGLFKKKKGLILLLV